MPAQIPIDQDKLTAFCRKHHIRRLSLFGSVLRDDFRDDSDVDVLYEFQPNQIVGFRIFLIEEELSQMLGGREVDLVSEKDISRRIRNHPYFHSEILFNEG
ncbi:MAG: nucleotidyltransferase domain-containing protein [Candidatus Electryoneaceae bacterium]|nr:nucleotidyltransferase domain-containing protein [Candidatus Electryoneaceae bacterium]